MHVFLKVILIIPFVLSAHIPTEIPRCHMSDPNFQECLKSSAEKAFAVFANGNKELGIPPLEPLQLSTLEVLQQPGPINVYQKYTDISVSGFSKTKVTKFTVNFENCFLHMELHAPNVVGKAGYLFKGQILVVPIDAEGNLTATFKDFLIQANCSCKIIRKQDLDYIDITSTKLTTTVSTAKFEFGTLIKGNELLDKEVHKVIDDDPVGFYELMRPAAADVWAIFLTDVLNDVFMKVPKDEIFIK